MSEWCVCKWQSDDTYYSAFGIKQSKLLVKNWGTLNSMKLSHHY